MQDEARDTADQGGQITWQKSELARSPVGESPALAEIMSKSLVHIQSSKAMATRHRIGEHELCWPDYSLVCAWAEELGLTQEETIRRLLIRTGISNGEWDTKIEDGRFKSLCVSTSDFVHLETLSASSIPSIKGLVVELLYLRLRETNLGLDLSLFPNLTHLECCDNQLTELDLSPVPNLIVLKCGENQLSKLDLSHVSNLTELECGKNQLSDLDLSHVPNLTHLDYYDNQLTELDLSLVPNLIVLKCRENQLFELDLSHVPNLIDLDCRGIQLTKLDLSHVPNLKNLSCSGNSLSELDLSYVPNLSDLACYGNQLTELDLSCVPYLDTLWCVGNQLTVLDVRTQRNLVDSIDLLYDKNKVRLFQRPDQNF